MLQKKGILLFYSDFLSKYSPNEKTLNRMANRPTPTSYEETLSNFCSRELFDCGKIIKNLESKVRKYIKVFPRFHVDCSIGISRNMSSLCSS